MLKLCREAVLAKLGHVSLDGTKVRANAWKHKAISYGRMEKKAQELEEAEIQKREEEDKSQNKKRRGRKPKPPSGVPDAKFQRNFTDPDSRIMKDGATKSFEQSYNCQAAVDEDSQIIVATNVTQEANDKRQLEPVFGQIKERRGFRRFLLRGLAKVRAEWDLICLTHNLLKLFRSGRAGAAT